MTPVFSYWTFGDPKGCYKRNTQNILKISFRSTWGNVALTTLGNLTLLLINSFTKDLPSFSADQEKEQNTLHIIFALCLVISWITLILLQNLQKCQSDQVFQKTALDPNCPDELIELFEVKICKTQGNELVTVNEENHLDHSVLDDMITPGTNDGGIDKDDCDSENNNDEKDIKQETTLHISHNSLVSD